MLTTAIVPPLCYRSFSEPVALVRQRKYTVPERSSIQPRLILFAKGNESLRVICSLRLGRALILATDLARADATLIRRKASLMSRFNSLLQHN